jgi:hypothetical protein
VNERVNLPDCFGFRTVSFFDEQQDIRSIKSNAVGLDGISRKFIKPFSPLFITAGTNFELINIPKCSQPEKSSYTFNILFIFSFHFIIFFFLLTDVIINNNEKVI